MKPWPMSSIRVFCVEMFQYFPMKIIGRLAGPDIQNLIDRFKKHLVAIGIEIAEQLGIRQQSAGADSENQAAVEHVIEHRHGGRDSGRMGVRHVDRAGAEPDLPGGGGDPGQECDAGGDVFGLVGDVFADIGFGKAELVGQQERFAVLPQG